MVDVFKTKSERTTPCLFDREYIPRLFRFAVGRVCMPLFRAGTWGGVLELGSGWVLLRRRQRTRNFVRSAVEKSAGKVLMFGVRRRLCQRI